MSSFIGHGLAALTIGKAFEREKSLNQKILTNTLLLFCAFAPDVDYVVPSLNLANNNGLRITHSIVYVLILATVATIIKGIFDRTNIFWFALQALLAGLSHLFFDALVGSRGGDPWFYPFVQQTFSSPLGILPSAGKLNLSNYYFYRNLLIECGILIPIFAGILQALGKIRLNKLFIIGFFIIFVVALTVSVGLNR